jgi:CheY-like chemotaxis protein/nitrogen-specific signal transduction histidine kinase
MTVTDELTGARTLAGVCMDVTARKRTEEALREADRHKDEFLAMLAHELRNPLAPIRNAAQVLRLVGPSDTHQQWAREVIERQTQHLTRLVDDLLDVSRITQGKVKLACEPLDLSVIIHRAVEASRPLIDSRHHQLTVVTPPEPVRLEGDLTRLVQVVGNLLNNAAKYTDEGGHIRIEAAGEGAEAVIRVRDNGMGVPADLLPHVFDLFTQADRSLDRSQGGLGIGLTLVRQLVELHGGRVEARSAGFGQGSEFTVRLPAVAFVASTGAAAAESSQPAARALKILVVEDNVDSAEMMSFLLRLGGHEVRTAHDGQEALEAARVFVPQAVLCDIGLPGMNGYEVAERLREQPAFQETPLIALTGYGEEEARRRSKEAGFDYHLVKPVEPEVLDALLDSLRMVS